MTSSPNTRLRQRLARAGRAERGAATAEYAAVTAAGCGFAGVLITLLTSDFGQQLLKTLLEMLFKTLGL